MSSDNVHRLDADLDEWVDHDAVPSILNGLVHLLERHAEFADYLERHGLGGTEGTSGGDET